MLASTFSTYVALAAIFSSVSSKPHSSLHRKGINSKFNKRASAIELAEATQNATSYLVCSLSYQSRIVVYNLGLGSYVAPCQEPTAIVVTPPTSSLPVTAPSPLVSSPTVPLPLFTTPIVIASPNPAIVKSTNVTPAAKIIPVAPLLTSTTYPTLAGNLPCTATGTSNCQLQQLALDGHNNARALHHVQPVTWNDTLATAALKWGNNCQWKHSGQVLFPFPYGENLYSTTSPVATMADAMLAFTSEEKFYDFSNPAFTEASGHFTQVVWKTTKQVGCAVVTCNLDYFAALTDKTQYFVCEYYPSGNWVESMGENVFAP